MRIDLDEYLARDNTVSRFLFENPSEDTGLDSQKIEKYFRDDFADQESRVGYDRVLQAIEDQAKNGMPSINSYTIDLQSFNQPTDFKAADFSVDNEYDAAFLHFVRNITTDYDKTYVDIIRNADQYVKSEDRKNAFHKINLIIHDSHREMW